MAKLLPSRTSQGEVSQGQKEKKGKEKKKPDGKGVFILFYFLKIEIFI